MFTGIIEEIGILQVVQRKGEFYSLKILAETILSGTKIGDSIAVNGVCLTVTSLEPRSFFCDAMRETLLRTTLMDASPGVKVNLERALTLQTRLGGHIVSGHVDEVARIVRRESISNSVIFNFKVNPDLLRFIAEKGSVTIDGISLTVVAVLPDSFSVSIIPHTIKHTILDAKVAGDKVNVEVDVMARYIVNFVERTSAKSVMDWEQIAKVGI